jgi:hypothetical protein
VEKKFDLIDGALVAGFLIVTGTICYMFATNQPIPDRLENIFWFIGGGLGLKKVPTVIGK